MKGKKLFPNENIITTKLFTVGQDWEIPIPGFFIISPSRKIDSITDFTEKEAVEFLDILRKVRRGMKDILGIKKVYLVQKEGSEYGFHFWLFPRYDWMKRFGDSISSIVPIAKYAKENMVSDDVLEEVRNSVRKMRDYMSKSG